MVVEDDLIQGHGEVFDADGRPLGRAFVMIDPTMWATTSDGRAAFWGNIMFDQNGPAFRTRHERVGKRMLIRLSSGRTIRFVVVDEGGLVWADPLIHLHQPDQLQ